MILQALSNCRITRARAGEEYCPWKPKETVIPQNTADTDRASLCRRLRGMCESGRPWIAANKLCDHQLAHSSCPSISWSPDFVMFAHVNWWHSACCSEEHFWCLLLRYETLHSEGWGKGLEPSCFWQEKLQFPQGHSYKLGFAANTPYSCACLQRTSQRFLQGSITPFAFSVSCLLRSLWQKCLSGFIYNFL